MMIYLYNSFENIPGRETEFSVPAVIDVFRASTTIAAALSNGAEKIFPVMTVEEAFSLKNELNISGVLLGGERQGHKVNGFDLGNSPFEYDEITVKGKTIILSTTNGTKSLLKVGAAGTAVICGFINMHKVVQYLQREADITIVLSGKEDRFSLEDAVCGGMLISEMLKLKDYELNDGAKSAHQLFLSVKNDYVNFLRKCDHGVYLRSIGFERDVEFCLTLNKLDIIPVYKEGAITSYE